MAIGLPFGWAPAPGIFTKFIRQALNAIRYPGKICRPDLLLCKNFKAFGEYLASAFLDDLIMIGTAFERTMLLTQAVKQLFSLLSLLFHEKKCELIPVKVLEHLGFKLLIDK